MFIIIGISILFLYTILGFKKPGFALITLPIACFLLVFSAVYTEERDENNILAVILFIPVTVPATLAAIVIGGLRLDFVRWPHIMAKWLLWILASVLLLFGLVVLTGPLSIYGFILFAYIAGAVIAYFSTSRHATAAYVLSTIGSSMRQNLPLPMALESAAAGQKDKRARILQNIKKWLVQGYSLSESIKRGWQRCPGYAVAMIAAAEKINQLPRAIDAIEADIVAKADETRRIKTFYPVYPLILIAFMFLLLLAVMTYVIPQFHVMLQELFEEAALPKATRILMSIMNFVAYQYGWLIALVLLILTFVIVPVCIRIRLRPRRSDKPYLISRIADFVKWHLPVVQWFEKNYSMVHVVELLRLSLNAGCTVNDAIANTLNLDVNNCFKNRLRKWLTKVERGENISDSARKSKLGSTLAWAFDENINPGNTLAILETLESFYRTNYNYKVSFIRLMQGPCVTIMMGLMVGFVVYAVFCPMVAIINHLVDIIP